MKNRYEKYRVRTEKKCCSCKIVKGVAQFDKNRTMGDGRSSMCKECRKEYMVNYKEYMSAYSKKRSLTSEFREAHKLFQKKYVKNNPEKVKAHFLVRMHKKQLAKDACDLCGIKGKLHMHHKDYSKPLDVNALCIRCHEDVHHSGKQV